MRNLRVELYICANNMHPRLSFFTNAFVLYVVYNFPNFENIILVPSCWHRRYSIRERGENGGRVSIMRHLHCLHDAGMDTQL
jgi:hypothetical protein